MRSTETVFGKMSSEQLERPSSAAMADEASQVDTDEASPVESTETTAPPPAAASPATGADDDDEADAPLPEDLDGLKRALANSRKGERKWKKEARERERRIDQLTGHVSALRPSQQSPAEQQPPKPKGLENDAYWEGPDGPQRFVRGVVDERFGTVDNALRDQAVTFHRMRINDAVDAFVDRVEDGKEHIDYFTALAANSPALKAQFEAVCDSGHNPAKFAYEYAKAHKHAVEASDPVAYEAKLRAKWEAERAGGQNETAPRAPTKAPKSIAHSRGTGGASKQAFSGPRSTEQVFGKVSRA